MTGPFNPAVYWGNDTPAAPRKGPDRRTHMYVLDRHELARSGRGSINRCAAAFVLPMHHARSPALGADAPHQGCVARNPVADPV